MPIMNRFYELHRHTEFSLFDGFGKIKAVVKRAKELGYTALGITDHGSISGIVEHYYACKEAGINPICGVEGYFQPSFNPEKPRYHLCLFAKNMVGYQNLCKMLSDANRDHFYKVANITWELLEKYKEGIICTSACIASCISQLIIRGRSDKALNTIKRFKSIFGDDFYIEIMPFPCDDKETQLRVDRELIRLAELTNTKIVVTVDSHFIKKEDFETHSMMFKIQKKDMGDTYKDRYMQSEADIVKKCFRSYRVGENKVNEWLDNLQEISSKCTLELKFEGTIPKIVQGESKIKLRELVTKGLENKKKLKGGYITQAETELDVIESLGFEDYFLLVHDFVANMRKKNIPVMFGRGSVCGSLVAYALKITNVDPIIMGTNFDRFLRKDKKKMPDVDIDISSDRREEAIEYINEKYAGKNTQICTFGYWRTDNLINDLAKVYGLTVEEVEELKDILGKAVDDISLGDRKTVLELDKLLKYDRTLVDYERKYDKLITHFSKLWGQIRFYGTHASGVAITSNDITDYMSLVRTKDGLRSCYDMENIDNLKILKLDVLGLENASVIGDIEELTGEKFKYKYLKDDSVYEQFRNGNTQGIFQFESYGGTQVIQAIQPDNFFDIVAGNALNRPAPKQLGMVDEYIRAKNGELHTDTMHYEYTKDSLGCLIYQETVLKICRELARMEWNDVDRQIKLAGKETDEKRELREKFVNSLVEQKLMSKREAEELHEKMSLYLFNKGHAVGYALIGFYQMYLKKYYPFEFYYAILKHAKNEINELRYKVEAVRRGIIILPPNVNGTAEYAIKEIEGNKVIQEGMSKIKNVGLKSALEIEKYAPFKNYKDFEERVPKRAVNARVKKALIDAGCFVFSEEEYMDNVVKYNNYLRRKKVK